MESISFILQQQYQVMLESQFTMSLPVTLGNCGDKVSGDC